MKLPRPWVVAALTIGAAFLAWAAQGIIEAERTEPGMGDVAAVLGRAEQIKREAVEGER